MSEKKRGGCWRVPERYYAKGEKKNAGSVVKTCRRSSVACPKKPSPLRGLGSWWLFFFPIGAGAVRGGRFVRAGAAPMVVAVAT